MYIEIIAYFLISIAPILSIISPFESAIYSTFLNYSGLLLLVYKYRSLLSPILQKNYYVLIFILYSLWLSIWGLTKASSYDEVSYIVCIAMPLCFIPIFFIIGFCPFIANSIKYISVFCFVFSFFKLFSAHSAAMGNYGGYTALLYLLIFLLPYVNKKLKIILCAFWVTSFVYDLTDRTHILIMLLCLITSLYSKKIYSIQNIQWLFRLRHLLLWLPFIFMLLAVTNIFNIFSIAESNKLQNSIQRNVDTRTSLYQEVIKDQTNATEIIFGKSAIGKYKSNLSKAYHILNFQRMGVEVGALEFFLRGGIIYIIILFMVISYSSYKALNNSNNTFIRAIGIFILIYWNVFFIELQMGINFWTIAFWIALGLCNNVVLQTMNDAQIKEYLKKHLTRL